MRSGVSSFFCRLHVAGMAAFVLCSIFSASVLAQRNLVTGPRASAGSAGGPEARLALVIGNATYKEAPLKNAANDAVDIAQALKELGFKAVLKTNATQRQMKDAIRDFGEELAKGGIGVFYFAGHGVQYQGRNYLVPIGASIERVAHVEDETVDANFVLKQMEEARNRVNIVILDACRNSPYIRPSRSLSGGLAQMDAAQGTLIAFATAPGSVAMDGEGRNGTYTKYLLRHMREPGIPVELMFKRVRDGVIEESREQQTPWESSSLRGADFFFKPGAVLAAPAPDAKPAMPSALAAEIAFWQTIKESKNVSEFEAYLQMHPSGQFTPLARMRIDSLRKQSPPAAAAPAQLASIAPSGPIGKPPAAELRKLATGKAFKDCDQCPEMVVIPAGKFMMGSPDKEPGRDPDEGPDHAVTIAHALAVGKFEVTRAQFAAFVQESGRAINPGCNIWTGKEWKNDPAKGWRDPGFKQTDSDPVVCVDWQDAKAYAQWLAGKSGKSYRLASEAEWEYAARAGTTTPYFWGANAADSCRFANLADQSARKSFSGWTAAECSDGQTFTAPVGRFQPNAFGLYDMAGNVWEWTEDCWNAGYAGTPTDGAAWTSGDCSLRVLRGGSWSNYQRLARSAHRYGAMAVNRGAYNGFRVVRAN